MSYPYTVAITIVNYNTRELSLYCLKKIFQAKIKVPFQVIFLDNASKDALDTIRDVKDRFPSVKIISETKNTGYTKGVNICSKETEAKYILNLNPDTVLESGVVEKMVEYMDAHPEIGLLGPQLLNMNGEIQESVYQFLTPEIALYRRTPLGKLPFAKKKLESFTLKNLDLNKIQEVDWILGAALFFSAEKVKEVGHLNEDMFLYLSDTYLAWQMWEQGYKVVYYPEVKIYHYHRRESRQGFFLKKILFNKAYQLHILDGITYFRKVVGKSNPRLNK